MSIFKEFREFFSRNIQVNTGSKPDQEVGFPTSYLVNGIYKFNRFLKGNYPSKDVLVKFIESITFKLNKEDRSQLTEQGLSVIATDANSRDRNSNPTDGTTFTAHVVPHQLPELVLSTDGSDVVVGTPIELGGLKLSILTRTLSGLFRKNYKLEVNVSKSIIIDVTSKKLQLDGDILTPGNLYYYGTNISGTKGYFTLLSGINSLIRHKFVKSFVGTGGDIVIPYSEISATNIFNVDALGTATTNNPKTDYIIQLFFLSGIGGSNWVNSTINCIIDHTSGDLTIPGTSGTGSYRVILIG